MEDILDLKDDDETVFDTSLLAKSSLKLIESDDPSLMKLLTCNETNPLPSHIQPFIDLTDILQPVFIANELVDVSTSVTNDDDPNEEELVENEIFCEAVVISESDPESDIIDLTQDT